jgi:hypothetical protein
MTRQKMALRLQLRSFEPFRVSRILETWKFSLTVETLNFEPPQGFERSEAVERLERLERSDSRDERSEPPID